MRMSNIQQASTKRVVGALEGECTYTHVGTCRRLFLRLLYVWGACCLCGTPAVCVGRLLFVWGACCLCGTRLLYVWGACCMCGAPAVCVGRLLYGAPSALAHALDDHNDIFYT